MPVTGNPLIDWILTIISAIAVVIGALAVLKGSLRKFATADGPDPDPAPFGRRSEDLRTLNAKHDDLEGRVDQTETRVIVLETKERSTGETVTEVKTTIERNRIEQRETNRELFGKLDGHQEQMRQMERDAGTRHREIRDLLTEIQQSNGGDRG